MSVTPAAHMASFPTPKHSSGPIDKPSQQQDHPRYYHHPSEADTAKGTITPPSSASRRYVVDEILGDILGIPKHTLLSDESVWPYNMSTLNEIVRFKVEQEKTKQESMRHETFQTSLQVLKMAQELQLDPHLVPVLFMHDKDHLQYLRDQLAMMTHRPSQLHRQLQEKSQKIDLTSLINPESTPTSPKSIAVSPTTVSPAPAAAPAPASPNVRKRRAVSDTHDPLGRISMTKPASASPSAPHQQPVYLPAPQMPHRSSPAPQPAGTPPVSHAQSAPLVLPPSASVASATVPGPSSAQQQPLYHVYYQAPPMEGSTTSQKLGSPYSQKYQSTVIMSSQPPPPHYIPMHYQYFVPSPGSSQPPPGFVASSPPVAAQPGQSPPMSAQPAPQAPSAVKQRVPSHQFQNDDKTANVFRTAEIPTDDTPNKRQKSAKSAINFMITTPKNPPAKKYNKDRS
ncbi:hypothetical protein DICA3_D10814 [Diutina catenulata]